VELILVSVAGSFVLLAVEGHEIYSRIRARRADRSVVEVNVPSSKDPA
jgi:hypothetical protein